MQQFICKRDDVQIAYYVAGNGPVLLGLSGFACSHYNFIDLVPELAKNFKVVLIDNRATGNSSGTTKDYKMEDLALDALAVMDELKVSSFLLAGISMGGFIAQEILRLAPNRVEAVALMCTTSGRPAFIHPKKLTEQDLRQMSVWDAKTMAEAMVKVTVHPSLKKTDPAQYQRIIDLRIANKMDLEEKIRQNKAAVEFIDGHYDLTQIKCPTYALAGEDDRFLSSTFPGIFRSYIKHAVVELIPETDHYFFLEKPKLVADKLTHFFQGKL